MVNLKSTIMKVFKKVYYLVKVIFYSIFKKDNKNDIKFIRRQINGINSRQQIILNRLAFLVDESLDSCFKFEKNVENRTRFPLLDKALTPIVFITDSNYVKPTFVAISSLIRSAGSTVSQVYVLGIGLSQSDIELFNKLEPYVILINTENRLAHVETVHRHVSKAALVKFELAEIFKQYDKILYLDSDITVHGNLAELLNTDVGDNYLAAVKDFVGMIRGEHHIKINSDSYFNSGVMLLNLKLWRLDGVGEKLLINKENDKWGQFMDQDALNLTFIDKVKFIGPKFNLMFANMNQYNLDENRFGDFYGIDIVEAKNIYFQPLIRHYSNIDKPWKIKAAAEYEIWQKEKYLAEYIYNIEL